MFDSQQSRKKESPSLLLVLLVCLTILFRHRRGWININPGEAARLEGISRDRISRLATRSLFGFEKVVATLTGRGRPRRDRDVTETEAELELARALLDVAKTLRTARGRKDERLLVVGAWLRLKEEFTTLTQERFCDALGIPSRTLRDWLSRPPAPEPPTPEVTAEDSARKAPKDKKRRTKRGRFAFGVTLPDTQVAGDTTDLKAFDVGLKLMAAQDVGGRDQDLIDTFCVDERETAEQVSSVLTESLLPGCQAITDQGTPYMSELLARAFEELSVQHAPQREGDPIGKSTIERALGTIKGLAGPILELTNRLASAVPSLRSAALAKPAASLIIGLIQRSYSAGARTATAAALERGSIQPEVLARLAEESRARAEALWRSTRLFLKNIHFIFKLPVGELEFVRNFRVYPLRVLQQAAAAYAQREEQLNRAPVRDPVRYFGAIVLRMAKQDRIQTQVRLRDEATLTQAREIGEQKEAQRAAWARAPETQIATALRALSELWCTKTQRLLFDGVGPARAWLREGLRTLVQLHGPIAARDAACAAFRAFTQAHAHALERSAILAIEHVQLELLEEVAPPPSRNTSQPLPIQLSAGRNWRPPPAERLRISAAGP